MKITKKQAIIGATAVVVLTIVGVALLPGTPTQQYLSAIFNKGRQENEIEEKDKDGLKGVSPTPSKDEDEQGEDGDRNEEHISNSASFPKYEDFVKTASKPLSDKTDVHDFEYVYTPIIDFSNKNKCILKTQNLSFYTDKGYACDMYDQKTNGIWGSFLIDSQILSNGVKYNNDLTLAIYDLKSNDDTRFPVSLGGGIYEYKEFSFNGNHAIQYIDSYGIVQRVIEIQISKSKVLIFKLALKDLEENTKFYFGTNFVKQVNEIVGSFNSGN